MIVIFLAGALLAVWKDLSRREIPNRSVLLILVAGLTAGWAAPARVLLGALLWGGALLLLYLAEAGRWGAGDVKLATALGAWTGPAGALAALGIFGLAAVTVALLHARRDGDRGPVPLAPLLVGAALLGRLAARSVSG